MICDKCGTELRTDAPQGEQDEVGGYELAERLTGIGRSTLYALVCQRRIPHVRFGKRLVRFSTAALRHWLTQHEVRAASCIGGTSAKPSAADQPKGKP